MSDGATMRDKERGVYRKYHVERVNDPDSKHDGCWYFVLDPNHDEMAIPALRAYIEAARRKGYTALADDLAASLDDGVIPEGLVVPVSDGGSETDEDDLVREAVEELINKPLREGPVDGGFRPGAEVDSMGEVSDGGSET